MGLFNEGKTDCVKELLKPAERVLKQGLDIQVESFDKRVELWNRILDSYDLYLEGECGEFLRDLDTHFRSKFEGALAILAWSFWKSGETYLPASRRYLDKEIEAVERVLRYNVFEIYTKEDIMTRVMHRDTNVLALLREYYHGVDKWIEEALADPEIKLSLRHFLKSKWDSYKGKVNDALAEATSRFDWLRDFLSEVQKEEESIEKLYQKQIEGIRKRYEGLMEEIRTSKAEEVERLRREKEELEKQIKELEEKLENDEEKAKLREELERMRSTLDSKMMELQQKEMELKRKELELQQKEDEVSKRIREVMELAGKVEKGSRFVRRDEAKILEMNFIGRMKGKFGEEVKLLGRSFKVEKVEERGTFDRSAYARKLPERDLKNIPDNRLVEVYLREKKLLGKKEFLTVRALFYGRPERYAEVGFDTDPLELADINALLVDARDEAKEGRIVLLVASPTGFEKRIGNYVNSADFHRNFISENVSLALLDLESGELIYNPHDEYAKAFEPFLRLEFDKEKIARIKDFVEERINEKGYVRLEEAVEHFDEDLVKRAFQELSKEKGYSTRFIEGVGYVLVKKDFM
ncbi:hypothetical protein [Thermococcus zilligii]|uniref:hypothetical protein n=1 Tax=Thermococcus zilligii TaxID=54076 RepID=UPI00029AC80C|nr:hypothetical protein [Thermococcus zilligii]